MKPIYSSIHPKADTVARKYIGRHATLTVLGWGVEGVTYHLSEFAAIKVHTYVEKFRYEVAAYRRLKAHKVRQIQGFWVPQLLGVNARLRVIKMSIVRRPFLLDFGSSRLDQPLYTPEQMAEWWDDLASKFDPHRLAVAQSVFYELVERYGIYYYDLRPTNLCFAN